MRLFAFGDGFVAARLKSQHGIHGVHGLTLKLPGFMMPKTTLLHGELTDRIIGEFLQVHRELGPGFLESIYSKSMTWALHDAGFRAEREVPISVYFRGRIVGAFHADIVVESRVLLELKIGERLDPNSEAQALNYLRATSLEVALILHFGPKPTFKRLILTNDRKLLPPSAVSV